ncbi:hypothetical protein F4803DRAFT_175579 [Xylaria telfairii]|nr:hypothetical protein F4803DRAFT_175579 [Xylaria telfairii]
MEVIGAIGSFIAIGQAIGAAPKIINALRSFTNASKELAALIDELEHLYVFYEYLRENVDLFSGEHNPSILRVQEPPYLKLVRKDVESLIVELQELVDSCLTEAGNSLTASKLRWWRKRRDVARLRDECRKQRQQLENMYMLFRDQLIHKQGQLLVHIHARIPHENEHPITPVPDTLPSLNENDLTPLDYSQDGVVVDQSNMNSPTRAPTFEEITRRRCRCPCHAHKTSKTRNYGLHISLSAISFLSYQSQKAAGSCKMNCCAATQSFVALRFRIPISFYGVAVTGTFKFGFPLNVYMSLTSITRYRTKSNALVRVCHREKAEYLNQFISIYAGSIQSLDGDGFSVLEVSFNPQLKQTAKRTLISHYQQNIVYCGGYSLLTYCTTTWSGLIKQTDMGKRAAYNARIDLLRGCDDSRYTLSASDEFHITNFIKFMEIEDDGYDHVNIVRSENPIQSVDQALLDVPDILTKRSMGGHTLLDYACFVDNAKLAEYVLELGAPFTLSDIEGNTPLHIAIDNSAWQSAQLLVKQGHPVNTRDKYGFTPLTSTILRLQRGEIEAIHFAKTLLLRGADVSIPSYENRNVWHLFPPRTLDEEDLRELCEMLFKAGGAPLINLLNDNGQTPLMAAILGYNVSFISFLQKFGASVDILDRGGHNYLHWIARCGDFRSCRLAEELEIDCIDIRTATNSGNTPLMIYRWRVYRYYDATFDEVTRQLKFATPYNMHEDNPGEEIVSKSAAFERLLRSIRDRMLIQEIKRLEVILSTIRAQDLSSAREELRRLAEGKVKAKIDFEAETFRAIELDVRMGRLELAIESIEEFIEVSRDRMRVSPFDEEEDPYESSDSESENSDDLSRDGEEAYIETETGGSDGEGDRVDDAEREELEDEEDGCKTAEED